MSKLSSANLPMPWVSRIFDKLTLTYGQSFLRRWSDIDIESVKADWAHELAGFEAHPEAIAWALQNLPPAPPTVLEFRALARKSPPKVVAALEAPRADPDRVAAEVAKLDPVIRQPKSDDGRDWARRILARVEAGDRMPLISVRFAREALKGAV